MKIELDYNIVSAEDRCSAVQNLDLSRASARDLEKVANYILYGKSATGKALPQAKAIVAKHSTWKRKEPESLDALMENVLFDEQTLKPFNKRTPYTNPKPTIDRIKDAGIPGMVDLWRDIAAIEKYFEQEKEKGKTLKVYYLRHLLIDLRKDQYLLKALFHPPLHAKSAINDTAPHEIDWFADSGYAVQPLLMDVNNKRYIGEQDWEWRTVAEHTIDLTNPTHIYHILDNYSSLCHQIHDNPMSNTLYLLKAVEKLIDKTKLSPARYHILIRKIDHASNEQIAQELISHFALDYATNYISTIWTKEICGAIAKQGEIDRDEALAQGHPHKWKRCTKCHTNKLRDTRFFATKRNTFDGYLPVCRECQRKEK